MNEKTEEIMLDLLCKKAVYGLNEQEERELAELQREAGVADEALSFELTAAAIGTIGADVNAEMPAALRERILADAERYFQTADDRRPAVKNTASEDVSYGSWFGWLGWAFATVALIALGLNIYFTEPTVVVRGPDPTQTPTEKLTPAQMRERLMASGQDLARGVLGPGKMSELKPTGDVVWSDAQQAGYIRLSGLPKNDPNKETYQIWIIAENQDPKTPVDGGTFDVNSDGEVIIPIDAKVKVQNPQAFAITIEKPGGVVVSKQEKLAALAKKET
jgi:anti-sigma-K factor RskA